MGVINPFAPASMAPANADSSQGCATAVTTGSRSLHRSSSCSYFPVPDFPVMIPRASRLRSLEFHQQSVTDNASPASLVSLYLLFMSLAVSARAMMVWSRLTR